MPDKSFIINENDFTSDAGTLQAQLQRLIASGPEVQCDVLDAALNSDWHSEAAKVVVLITDSPPRGIKDCGDGFPEGYPGQNDPVRIINELSNRGITFNVIACEPTLSNYYDKGLDLYRGLVAKTPGGTVIPLGNTDANQLQDAIVGLIAHSLDISRLASKYGPEIRDLAQEKWPLNDIVADIYDKLKALGVQSYQVDPSDDVHPPNEQREKSTKAWKEASSLKQAAITHEDVSAIVLMVLKAAGIEPELATIFLPWIQTKVSSIPEALWYIGWNTSNDTQTTPPLNTYPSPPKLIKPEETKKSPLWALVIGIDEYKHKNENLKNLSGCVADANDFVEFLTTSMGTPRDQIEVLHNSHATRQSITSSIMALATNDRIQNDDAIVIFYAGHGALAHPPPGWDAGGPGARIQMICPYDFEPAKSENENGQGILDITLGALLSRLANAKGDNVTVILDSCYSGSGTRISNPVPGLQSRGVDLPKDYAILATIDEELLRNSRPQQRKMDISPEFEKSGSASHVLLAASAANQTAAEYYGRGRFTSALMSLLRNSDLNTMTYQDTISRMNDLPSQTPQCEGVNSSRILFNGKVLGAARVLYRVTSEGGRIILEAGEAQGITENATFDILDGPAVNAQKLGSITVKSPGPCSTIIEERFTFKSPAYAVQTSIGDGMDVAIGLPTCDAVFPLLLRAIDTMKQRRPEKRNLRMVDIKDPPDYEIAVRFKNRNAAFELTDQVWVSAKRKCLSAEIPLSDPDRLYKVLTCAADFFYHLRRSYKASKQSEITRNISIKVFKLEKQRVPEVDYPVLLPKVVEGKKDNLNSNGVVRINFEKGMKINCGFELSSLLDQPLYVWAFVFNLSDLAIVEIYRPTFARGRADPSIPKDGKLSIGYGSGGSRPLVVKMEDSDDADVSYVKFFITTAYVNLDYIKQKSPFNKTRFLDLDEPSRELFDTLLLTFVIQRVPS